MSDDEVGDDEVGDDKVGDMSGLGVQNEIQDCIEVEVGNSFNKFIYVALGMDIIKALSAIVICMGSGVAMCAGTGLGMSI